MMYVLMLVCLQTKVPVLFLLHTDHMNNHNCDHGNTTKVLWAVCVIDHSIYFLPFFSVPSGALEMPLFSELPPLSFQIVGCAGFLSSQFLENNANQGENLTFKAFSRKEATGNCITSHTCF